MDIPLKAIKHGRHVGTIFFELMLLQIPRIVMFDLCGSIVR